MYRMQLDKKEHTVGDLSDLVQQGISSYLQTPRNKSKSNGSEPKTLTKSIFTSKSATEQGTLLEHQEGDKNSGDKDIREDRNNQQGQHTGRTDCNDSGSDSSYNSGSSTASSVISILQPRNNNQ